MKSFLSLVKVFILLECRTKELSVVIFGTVLLVAMLFAMGVGTAFLDPYSTAKVFPFIFWTTMITSSSIALGRSFETEMRCGILESLVSSGVGMRQVFFAKQMVVSLLLLLAMLFGLLILGVIFQIELSSSLGLLALLCLILSIAYSALGNILSVVSLATSLRSALLPVILIPCSFPLFFASLELTYGILQKDPNFFSSPWLGFSVFLALFYSVIGGLLFPAAVKGQM